MQKIISLVLCLCIALTLSGCSEIEEAVIQCAEQVSNKLASKEAEREAMLSLDLVCVATCPEGTYFKEPVTGIMYLWISGGYRGGLTVMFDIDGLPLNYARFYELYEDMVAKNG